MGRIGGTSLPFVSANDGNGTQGETYSSPARPLVRAAKALPLCGSPPCGCPTFSYPFCNGTERLYLAYLAAIPSPCGTECSYWTDFRENPLVWRQITALSSARFVTTSVFAKIAAPSSVSVSSQLWLICGPTEYRTGQALFADFFADPVFVDLHDGRKVLVAEALGLACLKQALGQIQHR